MALLMPDINLRRKRTSFQNFWQRALSGGNNDATNSDHIESAHSTANVSSWRQARKQRQQEPESVTAEEPNKPQPPAPGPAPAPGPEEQVYISVKQRALDHNSKHNSTTTKNQNQNAPLTIIVPAPRSQPRSQKKNPLLPSASSTPPKPRYIKRVQGPTLATVLDRIGRNEGNVTELDFSNLSDRNKRLEPYGGVLVARVLSVNRTVTRLVIRDHDIGDRGAVAIANMLRYNSTLQYIDLYSNKITDVGALAIAKALYGHESVQHLSMWSNAISNRGACGLADALKCNRTLKYLGLVHNRITAEGAQALLEALEQNVHLETLNLATNRVPMGITTQIRVALARNRVEAPRLISTMKIAEEEVQQRLEMLRLREEESEAYGDEEDCSEASGFLSCSDYEDQAEDSVWI